MKTDASNEQRFIAEVDAFEFDFIAQDIDKLLHSLNDWYARLTADLRTHRLEWEGLAAHGALAAQAEAIDTLLRKSVYAWSQRWATLEATQALADCFDDRALLLVFGKFNAGKSTFCNFLADRFAAHDKTVQYFHVDAGRIVETSERFREGATETTSRLQGVRLGEKLVLLDTPGLHSTTPENAALTQRFTDSADGVLWLSSSTSPGQVQELEELGRELHRNKPLLPVVTRSDVFEEDEVDGEIVKHLRNKTTRNRSQQELDIQARAEEKLVAMGVDAALLKSPVSISAYMAREQGQTPVAMTEAGFEKLYAALLAITEPALAYKRRKQAEILLHHLEENVSGMMRGEVLPLLTELDESSQVALDSLERRQEQIANAVWRSIVTTLPELLEKHAAAHDVKALCDTLSQSILERFSCEVNRLLADYVVEPEPSLAQIHLDNEVDFEDVVIEYSQANGTLCEVAGVDYGRLHASLGKAIQKSLLLLSSDAARQCRASITRLQALAGSLESRLRAHEHDLLDLKRKVRFEST